MDKKYQLFEKFINALESIPFEEWKTKKGGNNTYSTTLNKKRIEFVNYFEDNFTPEVLMKSKFLIYKEKNFDKSTEVLEITNQMKGYEKLYEMTEKLYQKLEEGYKNHKEKQRELEIREKGEEKTIKLLESLLA